MTIRLIDAGMVSPLRSQTIYHGLAYARTAATPDTIVLATPAAPYVCVGFHQDLAGEVDLDYCAARQLPVLRRETGGGAVYLDSDQLFVQWVMGSERLPARIERRFALFTEPLVATYRSFGIEAVYRPSNDVHVAGRKIVGTGAAHIGNAEVLVGNFIFDFDREAMSRVINAPSAEFRQQVRHSLDEYMTSFRHVCGNTPNRDAVATTYLSEAARSLAQRIEPGELNAEELAAIEAVDAKFESDEFRLGGGGLRRPGVKIHEDVYVAETVNPANGLRVTARLRSGQLECLVITGATDLGSLTERLRGAPLNRRHLSSLVGQWHARRDTPLPFPESTIVDSILDLAKPQKPRATP